MTLNKEQAEQIKKQLLLQIESSNLRNKDEIKQQILNMNESQLEAFLKQQNENKSSGTTCIFCSIIKGEIPSYKIDENKNSIAILEINPLSKGHSLIIPFEHISIDKIPNSSFNLAKKIAKKIKTKFKAEEVKIESSSLNGHAFINVIPIYEGVSLEKKPISENELKEIQSKLKAKKRISQKKKINKKIELLKIPFRIP